MLNDVEERLNKIIKKLNDLLVEKDSKVYQELNGYMNELPMYRKLTRDIVIDYENDNGEVISNEILSFPLEHPNDIYLENMKTIFIYSGLILLKKQLSQFKKQKMNADELNILMDIFGNEFKIIRAAYVLPKTEIINMLKKIELKFHL